MLAHIEIMLDDQARLEDIEALVQNSEMAANEKAAALRYARAERARRNDDPRVSSFA